MSSSLIQEYFPELRVEQLKLLNQFAELLTETNASLNLISRKSEDEIWVNHILHSLSIAKVVSFRKCDRVLDVGTGGGLPGIPLAIIFPDTQFLLVDSVGKKIKAVRHIVESLGLKNVKCEHARAEEIPHRFQFVVSRAVAAFPKFTSWFHADPLITDERPESGGLYYIKGGEFENEIMSLGLKFKTWQISDWFQEEFFETKKVVWVRLS